MIIKTEKELLALVSKKIHIATKNVVNIVASELRNCIDEQYYSDPYFYPNVYQRTQTFLNSVTVEMLSNHSGAVYVDMEGMHYRNGFDAHKVVKWASESKHGADYYQTSTQDFWSKFIEWLNENLYELLEIELMKLGIVLKK